MESLRKRRLRGSEEEILSIYSMLLHRSEDEVMPYFIENDTDAHAEELEEKCLQFFIRNFSQP